MAGFLIAIISGALMSVQGVFNTTATKSSSIWVAASFVQITAFATCVLMWFYDGRPPVSGLFQVQPKYALLGGVIGAFITYTVVRAMGSLGTAKAEITIVISQIAVAYIIELFGMFGSKRADFSWLKLLGLALAIGGGGVWCCLMSVGIRNSPVKNNKWKSVCGNGIIGAGF